jgi:hypothetical protein
MGPMQILIWVLLLIGLCNGSPIQLGPQDLPMLSKGDLLDYLGAMDNPMDQKPFVNAVILQCAIKNQTDLLQAVLDLLHGYQIYSFRHSISEALILSIMAGHADVMRALLQTDLSKGHRLLLLSDLSHAAIAAVHQHNWVILDELLNHVALLGSDQLVNLFADIKADACYHDSFIRLVIDSREHRLCRSLNY